MLFVEGLISGVGLVGFIKSLFGIDVSYGLVFGIYGIGILGIITGSY